MPIAPIRSPLDMYRAQARLAVLAPVKRDPGEELEYAGLREAIEHYRCLTDRAPAAIAPVGDKQNPFGSKAGAQRARGS